MPAGVASDAGEAVMGIPAFDEAIDRLHLDRTLKPAGGTQFPGVARDALVERARPRIARAVGSAARRNAVPAFHPACNARRSTQTGSRPDLDGWANACKRATLGK